VAAVAPNQVSTWLPCNPHSDTHTHTHTHFLVSGVGTNLLYLCLEQQLSSKQNTTTRTHTHGRKKEGSLPWWWILESPSPLSHLWSLVLAITKSFCIHFTPIQIRHCQIFLKTELKVAAHKQLAAGWLSWSHDDDVQNQITYLHKDKKSQYKFHQLSLPLSNEKKKTICNNSRWRHGLFFS
jgi:hypothetical protein